MQIQEEAKNSINAMHRFNLDSIKSIAIEDISLRKECVRIATSS